MLLLGLTITHQIIFVSRWMFLSWAQVAFADISGDVLTWDRDEELLPAYIFVAISVVEIVLLGIVIGETW
jgi:hypothetical protein